jgi:hypothetical protein
LRDLEREEAALRILLRAALTRQRHELHRQSKAVDLKGSKPRRQREGSRARH